MIVNEVWERDVKKRGGRRRMTFIAHAYTLCRGSNTIHFTPREYFSGLRFVLIIFRSSRAETLLKKSDGQRQQTGLSAMQTIGPSRARREHSMCRLQRTGSYMGQHELGCIHMHTVCRSAQVRTFHGN